MCPASLMPAFRVIEHAFCIHDACVQSSAPKIQETGGCDGSIPELRRLRQNNFKFQADAGYKVRPYLESSSSTPHTPRAKGTAHQ